MSDKKTADMKTYQAEYRKKNPKSKEEQSAYMKGYIKNAESLTCPVCGGKFKTYSKYKHDQTSKHLKALIDIKDKEEKAKLKKEEEELQQKALAEAEAKRNKPIPAPRKKKEEPKPVPAPRKKKEEPKESSKEKHESLKMLEDYGSSSEEEEEDKNKNELKNETFKFQTKKINNEEVVDFIKAHFEKSVNPNRPADTKTKRQNKDLSLWKKVSAELEGKTWKYLGENFGKIVSTAYPKPSSSADLISLLKRVVMNFSIIPKPVEQKLNDLARKLKSKQLSEQT